MFSTSSYNMDVTSKKPVSATRKKIIVASTLSVFIVVAIVLIAIYVPRSGESHHHHGIIPGEPPLPESVRGVYKSAAVVSDAEPCAPTGRKILNEGGSAVDAAISTLLCMGVVNGQSLGLGGGFLMTIYSKEKEAVEILDARETAPGAAKEEMYAGDESKAFKGGLAVAVPGEVRGYDLAYKRYGKVSWSRLFEDAIKFASEGFLVSKHLRRSLLHQKTAIFEDPGLKKIYVDKSTGKLKNEGDVVYNVHLAESLKAIAENGPDEMYTGDVGTRFVDDVKKLGGIITKEDMANYEAKWRTAESTKLSGGLTVHSVPPPGSGAIFNFILSVLDKFKWTSDTAEDVSVYQRIIETFKYAFAQKSYLGDPDFEKLGAVLSNLTSDKFAHSVRHKITLNRTFDDPKHYGANKDNLKEDYGTAHMSVVAENGDAVSVTSTVNFWFGAGLMSPNTGIILNNEMDDFSFTKASGAVELIHHPANHIEGGKRPLSSMCPAIFVNENGDAVLTIGAAGGTRIITGTALVALKILTFGKDIKKAIDEPRVHHQLAPNDVEYERGINEDILAGLKSIGHKLKVRGKYGSVVVGIHRNSEDELIANYDFRKGGSVDGY